MWIIKCYTLIKLLTLSFVIFLVLLTSPHLNKLFDLCLWSICSYFGVQCECVIQFSFFITWKANFPSLIYRATIIFQCFLISSVLCINCHIDCLRYCVWHFNIILSLISIAWYLVEKHTLLFSVLYIQIIFRVYQDLKIIFIRIWLKLHLNYILILREMTSYDIIYENDTYYLLEKLWLHNKKYAW